MTKFIYVTDSHYGANPHGYQQQQAHHALFPRIIKALQHFTHSEKDIDFILHGGDMIDATSEGNIRQVSTLFDFNIPLYLCLGNHDLTTPDALSQWLHLAPQFFIHQPFYTIETNDCFIHVIPNHWDSLPYYWEKKQECYFDDEQLSYLHTMLSQAPSSCHLLCTHSSAMGLPCEQTGFDAPFHAPNPQFTQMMNKIATQFPQLRCVLGGHSHLNMHVKKDSTHFVTASAMIEVPFEVKLFQVSQNSISIQTITLGHLLEKMPEYNFNKTFVQGRAIDREFSDSWNS